MKKFESKAEFKKNQEVTVTIDDLGKDGEGIGHIDGYTLFIKDALPGETVRAKIMKTKKGYGFARLVEIQKKAPGRVVPKCISARACGGCTLQHLSYEEQLRFKEKKVLDCLSRIGEVDLTGVEVLPIFGMENPWHYRNKAQFPVRRGKEGKPVVGFYAGRTHSVIPVTDCAIQSSPMKEILETILVVMEQENIPAYDEETHEGIIRHIFIRKAFATGEIMVCLIINEGFRKFAEQYGEPFRLALTKIEGVTSILVNVNKERTNVIMGTYTKCLWGKETITDYIGKIRYEISAQSFYQVNPLQTEKLYQTALEFAGLTGGETVWDMYCGIGTISLFLASSVGQAGKVLGVEIVPEAVENARKNAALNQLDNVEFFCGAAEDVVGSEEVYNRVGEVGMRADVVVVDPPRKGCDRVLLETICNMAPARIVYVSCDPATLARDVKILGEGRDGVQYEVKKVRTCDMFPQGGHVETVCLLSKLHSDQHIEVELKMDELDLTAAESKATYE